MGRESDFKIKRNREFPQVIKKEIIAGNINGIMSIRSQVSNKISSIFETRLTGNIALKVRDKLYNTLQILDEAMNEAMKINRSKI